VASGLPYRVGLCHCLDCRKHHGALFSASAMFPEDAARPCSRAPGTRSRCTWDPWTRPTS
jgi:hypothetical protein